MDNESWRLGINDEYCWDHHPGGWECITCRLAVTLPAFFVACKAYVTSLIVDHWIWGEYLDGMPCILDNRLREETTQEYKDALAAHILKNYAGVVKCHEWVQMRRYTTIDGEELDGPVNVLVQTWDKE